MSTRIQITGSTGSFWEQTALLKEKLNDAEAVIIGAGAGLSTAAGYIYTGERFTKYFADFIEKYNFSDMYSGGFYNFESPLEHWAYWSRYIHINRYTKAPSSLYRDILGLIKDKDYFVLTTNVDHCFQKSGFDKKRIFYTQGDYGLFQCSVPCCNETFDNEEIVRKMLVSQGYIISEDGELTLPEGQKAAMKIAPELVPICPHCGKPMTMNLRADDKFVEDEGWFEANDRYADFINKHESSKILFLELGVGYNTPGIIKYPFWRMTMKNENAFYACLNRGEAYTPLDIKERSVCIDRDIAETIENLKD